MGKIKKALIKLSKKVTGKDLTNEDSIGDVVNFMADNYEGGSSTMMIDLDEIIELNPGFNYVIDPNTVGCDAVKLFDYLSKGNILTISYTDPNIPEELRKKGIYPSVEVIYQTNNILIVNTHSLILTVSKIEIPYVHFVTDGSTQEERGGYYYISTSDMTLSEIVDAYNSHGIVGYTAYNTGGDYTVSEGYITLAEFDSDSGKYYFEGNFMGGPGRNGMEWDDTNQVFIMWSSLM